jgi:CrcB protein
MIWLAIAGGGAVGAVARHALASLVTARLGTWTTFPAGTFVVNLLGCFVAGMVFAAALRTPMSVELRALLSVGLLGGFTTFSAFGIETFVLLQNGNTAAALFYVLASMAVAAVAVWAGYTLIA